MPDVIDDIKPQPKTTTLVACAREARKFAEQAGNYFPPYYFRDEAEVQRFIDKNIEGQLNAMSYEYDPLIGTMKFHLPPGLSLHTRVGEASVISKAGELVHDVITAYLKSHGWTNAIVMPTNVGATIILQSESLTQKFINANPM